MSNESNLTPRRAMILGAIVEEYVQTAQPVGSRTVQERHGVTVSTATIRNEMSALERSGFIQQPHTSAGRVPADKGYRAYVDDIMAPQDTPSERVAWVKREYRRARDTEDLYRTTSRVLSQLLAAPAMVMAPPEHASILAAVKLMPVSATIVIFEYTLEPGGSSRCLLESDTALTVAQVLALNRILQERYVGRSTAAMSLATPQTLEPEDEVEDIPWQLLDQIKTALERDQEQRVYVDGAVYALDFPEYQRPEDLRPVVAALDEDTMVRRLLRPAARRGRLTVTIGDEQEIRRLQRCSVVAHYYRGPAEEVGALGIIGPTRLDYQSVISAVMWISQQLSEAFEPEDEEE